MHKYSEVVSGALEIAQSEAVRRKHIELNAYHLFYALLHHPKSLLSQSKKTYKKQVEEALETLPTSTTPPQMTEMKTSENLSRWITLASAQSIQSGSQEIGEEDLLKIFTQIFPELDLKLSPSELSQKDRSEKPDFLEDLSDMAKSGKLDPVIGRTKEIRAVMEILGRRSKNNPILVGHAGVGKTAIVEGLARAIYKGDVPDLLKDKTIYSLNLGHLMAGTKYRGAFEEKLQHLLKFIKERSAESILFVDEIHQIVGAGKTEGAMDAANLLKPALARGELHCIGATTQEEFQKYIMKDSALERRFRPVPVQEPTISDAVEILMGIRDKLEIHHGIEISEEAIYSSVVLSDQYITDKFLPDKAIDLVDEAASSLKLSAEAMPSELAELESEIKSKKIYAQIEKNPKELIDEIQKLEKGFQEAKKKWESDVLEMRKTTDLKNQLENYKFELSEAERSQDYELAGRMKYSLIPELEKQIGSMNPGQILGKRQVAEVISRQTRIPVEKILRSKQDEILNMNDFLNTQVFGQKEALKEISETLMTSYAGLKDDTRPLGSFLLLGPSGVGKTETAKAISEFLFQGPKKLVRLDMSEYSEKHSVAKLIGAPAGYVGYEEGGILTEVIRQNPYSVILFDEIEKAHRDFSDILLQILDDGRLTDSKGRTVDFKNTVLILTSNLDHPEEYFRPELLGRLDARLTYNALDENIVDKLLDKQVDLLNQRLKSKNVKVELDTEVREILKERGIDPKFGARPLQQVFNKIVIRPLSLKILSSKLPEGDLKLKTEDLGL